jgi:Glyoxalase/Bleomycin resistance protein/Dioxygenase superfamily
VAIESFPAITKGVLIRMSGLKDISFVRFRAPDVELGLRFLSDFGLTESASTNGSTYLRCAGPQHHIYVLEEGPAEFIGFGFEAESEDDLRALAEQCGAEVRESSEPGGGLIATVSDPDGYRVDIVHGTTTVERGDMRPPLVLNYADEKGRINETQRPEIGPAEIKRLGHVGIKVSSLPGSISWYSERFGLKVTDVLTAGPEDHEVAAFLRLDRGSQPVDHHTIVIFESQQPKFHHCAFETQDYDAVETSHDWMRDHEWEHSFGVGRHLLGSQVFDYWFDPWGRKHEHFADGDLFDQTRETEHHPVDVSPIALWGPEPPANFIE